MQIEYGLSVPVGTLSQINFGAFNRIVILGVSTPTSMQEIEAIVASYLANFQTRFRLDISPLAGPGDVTELLVARGFQESPRLIAKSWRYLDALPPLDSNFVVREVTVDHVDQWSKLSRDAWGLPRQFGPWFKATVRVNGSYHVDVFEDNHFIAGAALFASDGLGWAGFAATMPNYQGRGLQLALLKKRLHIAASLGCEIVHTESETGTPEAPSPTLRNLKNIGMERIYDMRLFEMNLAG